MKRLMVIALLLVTTSSASPRRVVHIPQLNELCPGGEDWDKVAECIKRQAPFTLLRDSATVKLVNIEERSRIGGIYLYTHSERWALRGEVRLYQERDLLSFERATYGKHSGYRIEVGLSTSSFVSLDGGETVVPAVFRYKQTSLCLDESYGCLQMNTACDVLVHGKAYNSFRGKLVYEDKQLKVVGDRANAGQYCVQGELVIQD